jgi:hypothetical protein
VRDHLDRSVPNDLSPARLADRATQGGSTVGLISPQFVQLLRMPNVGETLERRFWDVLGQRVVEVFNYSN